MRIGIVNDMPMAAEALRRAITSTREHQVAWIARSGSDAVTACVKETPGLVLMDLIMPGMDGVEATRLIMASSPCPILIVTVSVETNAARVFEAMGYGALDAVDTPALGSGDIRQTAAPLLAKIASIARLTAESAKLRPDIRRPGSVTSGRPIVAIGASAGGPSAVAKLLSALPADFPAAIVIVQHVDERFAAGMAEWLNGQSAIPVRLAREDDRPLPGTALLAGTNDHLIFKSVDRLGYTPEPRDYVYRPSVDVFFQSLCRKWTGKAVGVLLTGMGTDGAIGLKELRLAGHHTIAQDRASSAVYGMPKAAAALDAATEILPLTRIASGLVAAFPREAQKARIVG